jgi:hypothetical protein
MCRRVREELAEYLRQHHPEATVLREEMGNLVVRLPDGSERTWEMDVVYAAVARLPGMGKDPEGRQAIYRQEAAALLAPAPDNRPLSLATHGDWLRAELVPPAALGEFPPHAGILHNPVPELGLETLYVLQLPKVSRWLTERDLADLGLDLPGLHRLALENLGKSFPGEVVTTALEGSGSALQAQDGFNAARLLLVPERLAPGQELVALVPHQQMLLLLPACSAADPEKLRAGIGEMQCEHHTPLLEAPVRVTREGFAAL